MIRGWSGTYVVVFCRHLAFFHFVSFVGESGDLLLDVAEMVLEVQLFRFELLIVEFFERFDGWQRLVFLVLLEDIEFPQGTSDIVAENLFGVFELPTS